MRRLLRIAGPTHGHHRRIKLNAKGEHFLHGFDHVHIGVFNMVEVGSHEALMDQQGAYFRLYEAQARQAKAAEDVLLAAEERA